MEYISLNEEERCGYIVSEKLKKIWNIQLNMLVKLIEVCNKYNLKLIMYSGSMLGAVRHKGFIPWDDDMDVALLREDFNKLIEIAKEEFEEPLFFQTALTDRKFFVEYARLRNSQTTGMIAWNKSIEYNNGIYIDVFPLDGYIESDFKLRKQFIIKKMYKQLLAVYYSDESYKSKKPQIVNRFLKMVAHCSSYEKLYEKFVENLSKYNKKTVRLSQLDHEMAVTRKYWCEKKDFEEIIWVDFETIKVPIPKNYDEILRHFYGDYMVFPPESERGTWHQDMIIFEPDIPYNEYINGVLKNGSH